MDPNTALESILRGHMMADHCEALSGWLFNRGFKPRPLLMPVDCHEFFGEWSKDHYLTVTTSSLCGRLRSGKRVSVSWHTLQSLADSEY